MQQIGLTYFWPLTEQMSLDLDYTPCLKYEEHKRRDSTFIGNRLDRWSTVDSSGNIMLHNIVVNPSIVIYPEKCPITIKTEKKPNIFARLIYKVVGAKWEKA